MVNRYSVFTSVARTAPSEWARYIRLKTGSRLASFAALRGKWDAPWTQLFSSIDHAGLAGVAHELQEFTTPSLWTRTSVIKSSVTPVCTLNMAAEA